jgi:hypothetical protein
MRLFDSTARNTMIAAALLAVAGLILAVAGGTTAMIIGAGMIGVAAVLVVAIVFYLVGRSEDQDRLHHPHG